MAKITGAKVTLTTGEACSQVFYEVIAECKMGCDQQEMLRRKAME